MYVGAAPMIEAPYTGASSGSPPCGSATGSSAPAGRSAHLDRLLSPRTRPGRLGTGRHLWLPAVRTPVLTWPAAAP